MVQNRAILTTQPDGTKQYTDINKRLHSEVGPAVIYPNGDKEYWINGVKVKSLQDRTPI